jgi:ABC-type transporter Mla subunit MlaD
MLGKFGIFIVILLLVLLFFIVISLGAGSFSKKERSPEIKKYLRSVNILLLFIIVVGSILMLFLKIPN